MNLDIYQNKEKFRIGINASVLVPSICLLRKRSTLGRLKCLNCKISYYNVFALSCIIVEIQLYSMTEQKDSQQQFYE